MSILLCWCLGVAAGAVEAAEVVLPDEAIQRTYARIIQRDPSHSVRSQLAKDLKELVHFCHLAEGTLKTTRDVTETCHHIEAKAHELTRDRTLLERALAAHATRARDLKPDEVAPKSPDAVTTEVLKKFTRLQHQLDELIRLAHSPKASSAATRGALRTSIQDLLTLLEPSPPTVEEVPIPDQPTFGLYEPTPRAPREHGTVTPAYVQPDAPSSSNHEHLTPTAWLLAIPEAEAAGSTDPTPADLLPTLDAPLTPEIRQLAQELGGSSAAIYEYVKNGIEFESYYGSLKGALATLWAKRGNDVDQSSLLIALLRASNIPCRYVQGTVEIPVQQAMDWLGVKDPNAALVVLAAGNIPAVKVGDASGQPLALKMEHTWVEAYVPYGYYRGIPQDASGARWIPLDPSVKVKTYQPGLNVFSAVPFDEDRYLSKRQRELPTDFYQEQLMTHLNQSFPGRSLTEIGYTGTLVREDLQLLPSTVPYTFQVVAFLGEFAELPASLRNTVALELTRADGTSLLTTTFVLPEVSLKRITLSYPQGDGGLVPTIKLDGVTVATGSVRPLGESHRLKLIVNIPNVAPENIPLRETIYPNIVAGEYYAIGLDGHQNSPTLLEQRINRLLAHQPTIGTPQEDRDEIVGEFLNLSLLLYFRNLFKSWRLMDEFSHLHTVASLPNLGVARATLTIETAFDLPFTISPSGLLIDIRRQFVSPTPIDGAAGASRRTPAFHLGALAGSALEHMVWEELVKIESISTVKGLQFARERGIPTLTITPANLNEMLARLDSVSPERRITDAWKRTLTTRLSGSEPADSITTPQEKLFYNDWKGSVGLVVFRQQAKFGELYLIEGGLAGGSTTLLERVVSVVEKVLDTITGAINAFFDGDPVNIANGNLVHTETDFTIKSRGLPLLWKRVYNSKLNYDGPMGFGWVHFYDVHVTEQPDGSVIFLDDDGGQRRFTKNPDGSYVPPPGHYLTLAKVSDGWTMRDKSGLLYRFRSDGKLTSLEDPNGNRTTLSYDGTRLSRVTDALGRSLTVTSNAQGKIEAVVDFTSRRWAYAYDGEGHLTQATDPLNQTMRYAYYAGQFNPNNNHNLKTVTDREGHATTFFYYTNDRVFRHTNDLGETRTFSYNVLWQETAVTNENGFTKTFKYDEQGNLVKLIEETGAIWRYTWDTQHNRLSDIDPLGSVTTYTYDALGNVLSRKDPLGQTVLHTYESTFSKRTSTTDARGFRTPWRYDERGNLIRAEDALGHAASFRYDAFGNLLEQVDPRTIRTSFAYDGLNNLTERRTARPDGDVVTSFEYDPLGRLTARVDANGHRTQWTYDASGQLTAITQVVNADTSAVTHFTYDKNGRLASVIDAEGRTARFDYDAAGRRTKTTDALRQVTEVRYDKLGNVIAVVAANGTITSFEYDGKGNLTKTTNPLGQSRSVRYNLLDRVVASTDPNGSTTSVAYDALQRLTAVTDPLGHATPFAYDQSGNRTQITDAEGRVTQFVYDPLNRLTQVIDPLGGVTDYGYDEVGNLTRITDANGHTTTQEFDGLSRLITTADPLGNRWRFAYDGVGNRTRATDPTGQTIRFVYDALDRLIETWGLSPQGTVPVSLAVYTYDKVGNRTLAKNAAVTYTYGYDALNRLTQVQDSRFARPLTSTYDPVGNRTRLTDGEGFPTSYQYDEANRLLRIEDPFGGQTHYAYDPAGRRTSRRSPNGLVSLYTYDTTNRLTSLETKHALTGNLLDRFAYTYDAVDNRRTMTERLGEHRYTYDALDRLTDVTDPDGVFERFIYDRVGNRLSHTDASGTAASTYDTANRLLQDTRSLYSYDATGNLIKTTTADQMRTFRYDVEQHLVGVEDNGTPVVTYTYDAQGRRIAKQLGAQTTRFLYDGQQLLAEYSATNAFKARTVYGPGLDEPLLMVRRGAFTYLHQDGLGSVTAATDARGVLIEAYRYRAFGESRVFDPAGAGRATSAIDNPFLFTGREFDQETDLYYYRRRYYSQTVGRFLTPDPFPASLLNSQSLHRYSYVENNPINRLDPLGLRAEAAEIPESRLADLQANNSSGGGGGGPSTLGRGDQEEDRRSIGVHPDIAEFLARRKFEEGPEETFTRELRRGQSVEVFGGLTLTGRREADPIAGGARGTEVTVAPRGNEVYQLEASAQVTATLGEHSTTISQATFAYDPATRGVTILEADIPARQRFLIETFTGVKAFPRGPFPLPEN